MTSQCRFCQRKSLSIIFPANTVSSKKNIADYACTSSAFGIHRPIIKCSFCGIIYADEVISQEQVSTYYEVADDPVYFSEQGARRVTFEHYLRKLQKYYPDQGHLLDIGTNTGLFVKIALDSSWQAVGLEPNRWGVECARKNYGIKLINKPFNRETFEKKSFDVVTMWDVIEHFMDPLAEMEKVFNILKPGGMFAFSTVDPESFLAKAMGTKWPWYMEMHKVFFSKKAARYYLQRTGFEKVVFTSHWRSLSLGYLATRLEAVSHQLARITGKVISVLGLSKIIVPYYANDLYDCYAFK